jgi:hypothetical protein
MLGAQGLWADRDLYGATPAETRGLGLIRRTAWRLGTIFHPPIRIGVRIGLQFPPACHKRRLNENPVWKRFSVSPCVSSALHGAVFRMRPWKLRPRVNSRCGTIKIPPSSKAMSPSQELNKETFDSKCVPAWPHFMNHATRSPRCAGCYCKQNASSEHAHQDTSRLAVLTYFWRRSSGDE